MKNKIFMLLDRSGSMDSMWNEALGGINSYVKGLEGNPDIMLATFDTNGYDVIRNGSRESWKDITNEDVTPRGGTNLLDAAGRLLWNVIDSQVDRAMIVIITDGKENASSKFKKEEISKYTKYVQEKLKYDIVFLGANFDKIEEVAKNSFSFSDSSRSIATSVRGFHNAMGTLSNATSNYMATGAIADCLYSDSDKLKAKA